MQQPTPAALAQAKSLLDENDGRGSFGRWHRSLPNDGDRWQNQSLRGLAPRPNRAAPLRKPPISFRAKRVMIGRFNCGACEVTFDGEEFQWTANESNTLESGRVGPFVFKAEAIVHLEVNKPESVLGIWGYTAEDACWRELTAGGAYQPFARREDPRNGVRIWFTKDDHGIPGWPIDICRTNFS